MAGAVVGVECRHKIVPGNLRHDMGGQRKNMPVHGDGSVIQCGKGREVCGKCYGVRDAPLDVGNGAPGVEERKAMGLWSDAIACGTFGRVGQGFEIDTAG